MHFGVQPSEAWKLTPREFLGIAKFKEAVLDFGDNTITKEDADALIERVAQIRLAKDKKKSLEKKKDGSNS